MIEERRGRSPASRRALRKRGRGATARRASAPPAPGSAAPRGAATRRPRCSDATSSRRRCAGWSKNTSSSPPRSRARVATAASPRATCSTHLGRQGQAVAGRQPATAQSRRRRAAAAMPRRRRTRRASRADDAPARAHRRAPGAGAVDRRDAHHVQRSRPEGRQRAARPVQGALREGARREARLHVVLREGVRSRR